MAAVVEARVFHLQVANVNVGSSISFSVDCGTASNRYLLVYTANEGGGFGQPSSVTYNGVALTNITSLAGGEFNAWALGNTTTEPATGSNTLQVNWAVGGNQAEGIHVVAIALSNVDLGATDAAAIRSTVTDDTPGTSTSTSITTVAGDYVTCAGSDWQDVEHTPTGDTVERWNGSATDAQPTAQKRGFAYGDFIANDASASMGFDDANIIGAIYHAVKGLGADLVEVVNETEQSTEAPHRVLALLRLSAETAQISELGNAVRALVRNLAETETIVEGSVRSLMLARARVETIQIPEALARALGKTEVAGDTVQLATSSASALGKTQVASETAQLSEALDRVVGLTRPLAEAVNVAEVLARSRALSRPVAETAQLFEATVPARTVARHRAETVQVLEASLRVRGVIRSVTEALNLAETLASILGAGAEVTPIRLTARLLGTITLTGRLSGSITLPARRLGTINLKGTV